MLRYVHVVSKFICASIQAKLHMIIYF